MIDTYIRLYLAAFFWGGTFVAGRSLSGVVDPVSAAFFRFAIASLLLLTITIKRESLPKISFRQLLVIGALGASGIFAYNLFFFNGLTLINASRASLIIALNPVFITLAAAAIYREPLPKRRILGILLSVSGAIIVITRGQPLTVFDCGIGRGELLIFGCVIAWTVYSVIGKVSMRGLSPLVSVCYSTLAGTLLLFFAALFLGDLGAVISYPLAAHISLVYLGMFGTVVGFLWYFQGIRKIGASRAAVFINFVPFNGVLLATLILGEPLTLSLLTGGALVISGSYLANTLPATSPGPGLQTGSSQRQQ